MGVEIPGDELRHVDSGEQSDKLAATVTRFFPTQGFVFGER